MSLKLFAALLAATALAGCGIDATPESRGAKSEAASGSTATQAMPAEQTAAQEAEPQAKDEGEKKPE